MARNRGKQFEEVIKEAFEKLPDVSIDRVHDQTTGYFGSANGCDFIVYRKPHVFYLECKSVHGNTLSIHSIPKPDKRGVLHGSYGNITDTQWETLSAKSKIDGVFAGVVIWFVDHDVTLYCPIQTLEDARRCGRKSIRYDDILTSSDWYCSTEVAGRKKRVFFDYDVKELLVNIEKRKRR